MFPGGWAEHPRWMRATRVHYDEQSYDSAEDCVRAIRVRLSGGWEVSEVTPSANAYRVVFRLAESQPPAVDAAGASSRAGGLP